MKTVAIMDTSIMSFNLGDQIIMESAREGLKNITSDAFVVNMPTHSPLFHRYEFSIRREDSFRAALNHIDYKFVCGTNLLEKNMKKRKNSWNLNIFDLKYFSDYILVGVGSDQFDSVQNGYTERFYKKALRKDIYHSTRDEKTKVFLESLGLKAINTGCVTLWKLNADHCSQIPTKKQDVVVFTVTDYKPDPQKDIEMIKLITKLYKKSYCWLQGIKDKEYLDKLNIPDLLCNVKFIHPSLQAYSDFLSQNECDYVGTRLHAGIKAIQMKKRSIIVGVDNRARDMYEDVKFNFIDRNNIESLEELICSRLETNIVIHKDRIDDFIGQFR